MIKHIADWPESVTVLSVVYLLSYNQSMASD